MTVSTRPRKRPRPDSSDAFPNASPVVSWDVAVSALVERLDTIRSQAVALRDEHIQSVTEIEEKIELHETAARVVATIAPEPAARSSTSDVHIYAKGLKASSDQDPPARIEPPVPAPNVLMESEPQDKVIREQSIIVRAQAINRKNSELARERLPKQPEAQRNKTHHDYFLEEAEWCATDFSQERKWKIAMARKLSKMIMQYHAQRLRREARSKLEAEQKLIKIASAYSREVRKFWNDIGRIASHRSAVLVKARQERERQLQLKQLLRKTEAYSTELASTLRGSARHVQRKIDDVHVKQATDSARISGKSAPEELDLANMSPQPPTFSSDPEPSSEGTAALLGSDGVCRSREVGELDNDSYEPGAISRGGSDMDDERTLVVAEAEERDDPAEISNLQKQASMNVEELLRSQGIDPAAYRADKQKYLDSSSEDDDSQDDHDGGLDSEHEDDELTIQAAEAEEKRDVDEGPRLRGENELSVEDLLRSQGIDPETYFADNRNYLEGESGESSERHASCSPSHGESQAFSSQEAVASHDRRMHCAKPSQSEVANTTGDPSTPMEMKSSENYSLRAPTAMDSTAKTDDEDMETHQVPTPHAVLQQRFVRENNREVGEGKNGSTISDIRDRTIARAPASVGTEDVKPTLDNETATVMTPRLLRGNLREYQRDGMEWLVSLYRKDMNGILADEMGLGKTIQTIALLAWLALNKGIWGPHLIVVPTSVMVNWEVEFKKWLPSFKILTYFGSMKERKAKRQGWTKPNLFHVCITSYTLAVQDANILRRKKWAYLILDEAHNIKNFESQRWQTLLGFSSQRRLLITGTPLQNSVMELWSLMHFIKPEDFESHSEFKDWFAKPVIEAAEAESEQNEDKSQIVANLQKILRPFLLRRLKRDVEKGLPPKFEHIVRCRLSKRQRQLYEDFMSRSDIRETLQSGDFFGVMNVLMQLRKVCNHPDLFEGRPILSPLSMPAIFYPIPSCVINNSEPFSMTSVNLSLLNLDLCSAELQWPGGWHFNEMNRYAADALMCSELRRIGDEEMTGEVVGSDFRDRAARKVRQNVLAFRYATLRHAILLNALRIRQRALFGQDLRRVATLNPTSLLESLRFNGATHIDMLSDQTRLLRRSIETVAERAKTASDRFVCCITKAMAPVVELRFQGDDSRHQHESQQLLELNTASSSYRSLFRSYEVRSQVTIPDTRLVQWDCGKLQVLDRLLRMLHGTHSRALIFTQMTKVLDVLESFLNLHSLRYLRLDGTTKTDDRQKIVERFNTDSRIFCMILTTRAGGVGLNLTGADTVIFYDTDYNPAVDNQAADRAHRIGQTRPVHVYRLVSEQTVEENILRRANEKRNLESLVISQAGFIPEAIGQGAPSARPINSSEVLKNRSQITCGRAALKNGIRTNAPANHVTSDGTHVLEKARQNRRGGDQKEGRTAEPNKGASIETANGLFHGFADAGEDDVGQTGNLCFLDPSRNGANVSNDEYQQVSTMLLADDDEREKVALFIAEQEKQELQVEFGLKQDKAGVNGEEKKPEKNLARKDDIISRLLPIHLYALRLVESWQSDDLTDEESIIFESENRKNGMRTPPEYSALASERVEESDLIGKMSTGDEKQHAEHQRRNNGGDRGNEEGEDAMFYEIDTSEHGQMSYLKALTDADADIKLYLPLRDGGPEELKVSSVVSGTAAAGLECAEDAAFFPHAYNRMSRTPYATRRQKEKGLANLRKRRAEREAKRQRESQVAAAAGAAVTPAVSSIPNRGKIGSDFATIGMSVRPIGNADRPKGSRNKDLSRAVHIPTSKKIRAENSTKGKSAGASGNGPNTPDLLQSNSMGLFKKSSKKNTRKLSLPGGKAALASAASAVPGDGFGINDGWTREEDESLLRVAAEFNNNMFLVSDFLSSDKRARIGLRRHRTVRHCIDRLINALGKDSKPNQLVPKATLTDADVFRKHWEVMQKVATSAKSRPSGWIVLPPGTGDVHASHTKAAASARAKMKRTVGRQEIPPFGTMLGESNIPKHHISGFKTTETTPQALNRKRFPFIRPPRDDPRPLNPRGTLPGRYNAPSASQGQLQGGDPSLFTKAAQKSVRKQNQGSTQRAATARPVTPRDGAGAGRGSSRVGFVGRNKSGESGTRRGAEGIGSVVQSGRMPPSYNAGGRKGYFVPGTSGRMSIGPYGTTVQNIQTAPTMQSTSEQKGPTFRPVVNRVIANNVNNVNSGGGVPVQGISGSAAGRTGNGVMAPGGGRVGTKNGVTGTHIAAGRGGAFNKGSGNKAGVSTTAGRGTVGRGRGIQHSKALSTTGRGGGVVGRKGDVLSGTQAVKAGAGAGGVHQVAPSGVSSIPSKIGGGAVGRGTGLSPAATAVVTARAGAEGARKVVAAGVIAGTKPGVASRNGNTNVQAPPLPVGAVGTSANGGDKPKSVAAVAEGAPETTGTAKAATGTVAVEQKSKGVEGKHQG